MAGKQGGEGGSSMDGPTWIVLTILIIGLSYLFWTYKRAWLIIPTYYLDYYQYLGLYKINMLNDTGINALAHIQAVLTDQYPAKLVTFEMFMNVQNDISSRTFFLWCFFILMFTLIIVFKMKGDGFKKQFTLTGRSKGKVVRFCGMVVDNKFFKKILTSDFKIKIFAKLWDLLLTITFIKRFVTTKKEWKDSGVSFIHYQSQSWPVSITSAKFNPDIDNKNEASQKRPLDWMKENGISIIDGAIDAFEAERAFNKQMGPMWDNIHNSPTYVQAIMILAALNLLDGSNDYPQYGGKVSALRDKLAIIYGNNFNESETLVKQALAPFLKDKLLLSGINKKANRYAYLRTACLAVYAWGGPMGDWGGGKAGVLPSSMFRWLKKIDRTLWYALNNVGRRKYHIEGAGVVNHFFAERLLGKPKIQPHSNEAVEGLQLYVTDKAIYNLDDFYSAKLEKDFEIIE